MFDNVRRILCIVSILDPHLKTIKDTAPEFTENMFDMDSIFEFEFLTFCCKRSIDSNHNEQFVDPAGFKNMEESPCPVESRVRTTSKSLSPSSCCTHTPILYDV